jgi:hypothetical protein
MLLSYAYEYGKRKYSKEWEYGRELLSYACEYGKRKYSKEPRNESTEVR